MAVQIEQVPLPTGFVLDPQKTAGNAHSGHNVMFGVFEDSEVALKPFINGDGSNIRVRRNKAEHEKRMYELVEKLGYLTIKPIGVIEEHGFAYLLTSYMPNLMAGTSFDYTRPLEDSSRGKSIVDVVSAMTNTTGQLHEDAVTHGDAKLRNYPFNRLTGEGPYVVDLEGTQHHKRSQDKGREFFSNAVRNDLRSLAYNLGQNGLGANLSSAEQSDIFADLIMAPYVSAGEIPARIPRLTIDSASQSYVNGIAKFRDIDHTH